MDHSQILALVLGLLCVGIFLILMLYFLVESIRLWPKLKQEKKELIETAAQHGWQYISSPNPENQYLKVNYRLLGKTQDGISWKLEEGFSRDSDTIATQWTTEIVQNNDLLLWILPTSTYNHLNAPWGAVALGLGGMLPKTIVGVDSLLHKSSLSSGHTPELRIPELGEKFTVLARDEYVARQLWNEDVQRAFYSFPSPWEITVTLGRKKLHIELPYATHDIRKIEPMVELGIALSRAYLKSDLKGMPSRNIELEAPSAALYPYHPGQSVTSPSLSAGSCLYAVGTFAFLGPILPSLLSLPYFPFAYMAWLLPCSISGLGFVFMARWVSILNLNPRGASLLGAFLGALAGFMGFVLGIFVSALLGWPIGCGLNLGLLLSCLSGGFCGKVALPRLLQDR